MVSQDFKQALADIYRGEQVGEIIFENALQQAENKEQRYILGTMLQLETEGKALMRPVVSKLGLSLGVHPDAESEGLAGADGISGLAWTEKFSAMANAIDRVYLPRYEALATLVTEEEDSEAFKLATFMGAHERSILRACQNVVSGAPQPMAPVVDLLNFPLSQPSTPD